jgi:hypothetical protein
MKPPIFTNEFETDPPENEDLTTMPPRFVPVTTVIKGISDKVRNQEMVADFFQNVSGGMRLSQQD